jgi:hypothetical protein
MPDDEAIDIPSPMRVQAMEWQPILARAYPNHILTQILQRPDPRNPDNVVLILELSIPSPPPVLPEPPQA